MYTFLCTFINTYQFSNLIQTISVLVLKVSIGGWPVRQEEQAPILRIGASPHKGNQPTDNNYAGSKIVD